MGKVERLRRRVKKTRKKLDRLQYLPPMKTRKKFHDSEIGSKKEERLLNRDIRLTDKLRTEKGSTSRGSKRNNY